MSDPGGHGWQRHGNEYQRPAPYFGGYQGPSDYQGLGVYSGSSDPAYGQPPGGPDGAGVPGGPGGGPGGPGGKSRRLPIVLAVLALVLLAGGGTAAVVLLKSGSDTEGNAAPAPGLSPSGSPSSSPAEASTGSTPDDAGEIKVDAVTPGWQGVHSPKENVAYDVPANWEVEDPGVRTGLEDDNGKPLVIMHGVSTAKPGTCTEQGGGPYLGQVGFVTAGDTEPTKAARAGAKLWADATRGRKAPAPGAKEVSINGGRTTAQTSAIEVKPSKDSGCPATKISITTTAFQAGDKTALFVVFDPRGVPGAIKPGVVEKVIASLRPAG
ncbi:MAG: hypothetical protein GEU98_17850 [Pseudonocardiaceae bacterium]|nr:hypothetical protein [Pseudonocardiaceae bacterium]